MKFILLAGLLTAANALYCNSNFTGSCPPGTRTRGPNDMAPCEATGCTENNCCDLRTCNVNFTDPCPSGYIKRGANDLHTCGEEGCTQGDCCFPTCDSFQSCSEGTSAVSDGDRCDGECNAGQCCKPTCSVFFKTSQCSGGLLERPDSSPCWDGHCDQVECCYEILDIAGGISASQIATARADMVAFFSSWFDTVEKYVMGFCKKNPEDYQPSECVDLTTFTPTGHEIDESDSHTLHVNNNNCTRRFFDLVVSERTDDAMSNGLGDGFFRVAIHGEVTIASDVCSELLLQPLVWGTTLIHGGDNLDLMMLEPRIHRGGLCKFMGAHARGTQSARFRVARGSSEGNVDFTKGYMEIVSFENNGNVSIRESDGLLFFDVVAKNESQVTISDSVVAIYNVTNHGAFYGSRLTGIADTIFNHGLADLRNLNGDARHLRNTGSLVAHNISGSIHVKYNEGTVTIEDSSPQSVVVDSNSGLVTVTNCHGNATVGFNTGTIDIDATSSGYLFVTGAVGTVNIAVGSGVVLVDQTIASPTGSPTSAAGSPTAAAPTMDDGKNNVNVNASLNTSPFSAALLTSLCLLLIAGLLVL